MEAGDVLADDVDVRRPPFREERLVGAEADPGDVVDEGVEPDVDGVVRVVGERDPPAEVPAGHADVAQAAIQPAEHLIPARLRDRELRPVAVEVLEALLVLREPEEVVLLFQPLDRDGRMPFAFPVDEVRLFVEGLAAAAIQAFIRGEIDVVVLHPAANELLHRGDVVRIGRADESVGRDPVDPADLLELRGQTVHEDASLLAGGLRRGLDTRRVLVRSGEQEDIAATLAMEAGQCIGAGELVRVMQTGPVIDVRDRRRDVELLPFHLGILRW